MLREASEPRIIGYYTLRAAAIALHTVPADAAKRLGTYQEVPATLLGRLAVDVAYGGQGFGRRLLLNALQRSMNSEIGSALVIVDAIDERAANFYARFGLSLCRA